MIKENDLVRVHFSDGHTQEGRVISVKPEQEYGYVVMVKVYGENTPIHCRESDLEVITREGL